MLLWWFFDAADHKPDLGIGHKPSGCRIWDVKTVAIFSHFLLRHVVITHQIGCLVLAFLLVLDQRDGSVVSVDIRWILYHFREQVKYLLHPRGIWLFLMQWIIRLHLHVYIQRPVLIDRLSDHATGKVDSVVKFILVSGWVIQGVGQVFELPIWLSF